MLGKASDNSFLSITLQEQRKQNSACEITTIHKQDKVAIEEPLEVWVKYVNSNAKAELISTTMRTPGDDINLVKGWLFTLSDITPEDITDVKHTGTQMLKTGQSNRVIVTLWEEARSKLDKLERSEIVSSSCGVCGYKKIEDLLAVIDRKSDSKSNHKPDTKKLQASYTTPMNLNYSNIVSLTQELSLHQPLFAATGGTHGVGLFDAKGTLLDVREDVGRHNAMDKIIGANLPLIMESDGDESKQKSNYGVILSGRVSFDMVLKAVKAQFAMIIAVGAPSSLAIELAQEAGITLYGFVSEDKINCYT